MLTGSLVVKAAVEGDTLFGRSTLLSIPPCVLPSVVGSHGKCDGNCDDAHDNVDKETLGPFRALGFYKRKRSLMTGDLV